MQVTKRTLDILKNFSTINTGIVVVGGSDKLRTINVGGTMCGVAQIDSFGSDFAIYDLPEFLNMMGAFEEPTVDLQDGYMVISSASGKGKCKYVYADPSLITTITDDINLPSVDVSFTLTQDNLAKLNRAGQIMGLPDMIIENESGKIVVKVLDKTDNSSNAFELEVGECDPEVSFSLHFKTEPLLKLMPFDYQVDISSQLISRFSNGNEKVTYYVSLEDTSSYEG